MTDIRSDPNRFKYIEDARKFALERAGNDVIKKDGEEYLVESMEDLDKPGLIKKMSLVKDTIFGPVLNTEEPNFSPVPPEEEFCLTDCITNPLQSVSRLPDAFDVSENYKLNQLQEELESTAVPVVEFVLDTYNDGDFTGDEHYQIKEAKIDRNRHILSKQSERLKSPVA